MWYEPMMGGHAGAFELVAPELLGTEMELVESSEKEEEKEEEEEEEDWKAEETTWETTDEAATWFCENIWKWWFRVDSRERQVTIEFTVKISAEDKHLWTEAVKEMKTHLEELPDIGPQLKEGVYPPTLSALGTSIYFEDALPVDVYFHDSKRQPVLVASEHLVSSRLEEEGGDEGMEVESRNRLRFIMTFQPTQAVRPR